ncbi:MAG: YheV family putative zinc ribbon protein [Pseudomonadota bacterium]
MAFKSGKRFIAGAVCPRCSAMDKLVTFKENGKTFRECVSCGFKDEMRFQQSTRELETRVNVTDEMKQSQTQVLILDPNINKGDH